MISFRVMVPRYSLNISRSTVHAMAKEGVAMHKEGMGFC